MIADYYFKTVLASVTYERDWKTPGAPRPHFRDSWLRAFLSQLQNPYSSLQRDLTPLEALGKDSPVGTSNFPCPFCRSCLLWGFGFSLSPPQILKGAERRALDLVSPAYSSVISYSPGGEGFLGWVGLRRVLQKLSTHVPNDSSYPVCAVERV